MRVDREQWEEELTICPALQGYLRLAHPPSSWGSVVSNGRQVIVLPFQGQPDSLSHH